MVKKALLIGINYLGTNLQLSGCINDVYNIRDLLVKYCDYSLDNIRVLTDKDISPTCKNIKEYIAWLISNNLPGDSLFFHYSGHGSNVPDRNGDETDKRDETIIPLDYTTAGMITDDWLFSNFISLVPEKVTLWALMDCCHSGTILDLKYNYRSRCKPKPGKKISAPYVPDDWTNEFGFSIEKSKEIKGKVYMLSGALDSQYAADAFIAGKAQGAFTACFVDCFKTNLIKLDNGQERFKSDGLKIRHILKDVNARLIIGGYTGQSSQFSTYKLWELESFFNP
jgi:hypothetical protein